jgi:transcription elongation factor S-II
MPLDAKAVEQKGRDLTKAAESSADSVAVLRLLSDLKTGVLASENLLRSTKIGVTVNKLKQHSNPQVKQLAGELVSKWRNDVQRLRPAAAAGSSGASTPRPASAAAANGTKGGSSVSSPAAGGTGSPKGAVAKRPDVPKEKRNSKTDGINWKVTGSATRDSCVKLMYDGLAFMSEDRKSRASPPVYPESSPSAPLRPF